jgi:Lrp/AsnC family transcriptional regulator, regulator for asnA, asnC and gidA
VAKVKAEFEAGTVDLDALDKAILKQLSLDPNASKSTIAKSIDASLALISSRMQILQPRKAVHVRPVINVNKAGRVFVFCKMAINSTDLVGELRKVAKIRELVSVSAMFGGRFNALIYFTFGDMDELHHIISEVLIKVDGVCELETFIISGCLIFKPEYIDYPGSAFCPNVKDNAETLRLETLKCGLDELDIAIISELQCNGRKSIRAIARDYEVSPGTIRYRLRQMEDQGIIQFVTVVDHRELSLTCFLFVEMRIEPTSRASIVEALSDMPWLGHLHEVVGASDLIAFINTRDIAEAHDVISNHVRTLAGIKSINVRMLMEYVKLDPRWGFASSDT